jgi:hypothetical protein
MRFLIAIFAVGVLIDIAPADAAELCGEAPSVSDRTAARGVSRTAEVFKVSAAAGKTFADLAATFYLNLSAGHSSEEARSIAGALLHASCIELTRGEDPAKLPWHVKNKLAGLSTLVPDFHEAAALLARIKAAETQR